MTDTEKQLFKLSNRDKGSLYFTTKYVHQEKNIYAEQTEHGRWGSVYVREEGVDDAHSVTFVVSPEKPFEILIEHVEHIDNDAQYVHAWANQRRSGGDYPSVDTETLREVEERLQNSYGAELEEEGWEQVGWRVGFRHGEVEVKKVDSIDDD